jgi:hypothetical protein
MYDLLVCFKTSDNRASKHALNEERIEWPWVFPVFTGFERRCGKLIQYGWEGKATSHQIEKDKVGALFNMI